MKFGPCGLNNNRWKDTRGQVPFTFSNVSGRPRERYGGFVVREGCAVLRRGAFQHFGQGVDRGRQYRSAELDGEILLVVRVDYVLANLRRNGFLKHERKIFAVTRFCGVLSIHWCSNLVE